MNGAGKAVGRQPLRHGVCLDEGAIDLIGFGCQDAMQSNGVGHGCFSRAGAPTTQRTREPYTILVWYNHHNSENHHEEEPAGLEGSKWSSLSLSADRCENRGAG